MIPFVLFVDLFSEGRRTEPDYLEKFAETYAKDKVKITRMVCGEPLDRLIDSAIKHSKQQNNARFANRLICVIADKDVLADADITQAINKIQTYNRDKKEHQKIKLYISNPCIEVWALSHFMDKGFPDTARACQTKLKDFLPKYDHDRGMPLFDIKLMTEERYQKAKRLALSWKATAENNPNQFPYTDIIELLEKIKRIGI